MKKKGTRGNRLWADGPVFSCPAIPLFQYGGSEPGVCDIKI